KAFEEVVVLLLQPRRTLLPPGLANSWVTVQSGCLAFSFMLTHCEPGHFMHWYTHLNCTPNIWVLHNWN
ncbi:hypothetical protein DBR06_SOUSAS1710031, partial [Sousa chinensis]